MAQLRKKVLVAMSGGVDSSVAAYLLKAQGLDVVGVSMHLVSCHRPTTKSCCSAADRLDAHRVCEMIDVPHFTLDYREEFRRKVIQPFVASYARGRTPIPCTSCNAELKFSALFHDMKRHDAAWVATGHYARVTRDDHGFYRLFRGTDVSKDQSYYLFQLTQTELSQLSFPLGDLLKSDVRRIAQEQGFATYDKPESQEICFVADDDYASFVESQAPHLLQGEGDFIDRHGHVVGRHVGIHAYTVGQRRGLGKGFGRRMYVVEIRPDTNQIVLGVKEEVMKEEMLVKGVSWVWHGTSATHHQGNDVFDLPVHVRIRSMHEPQPARLIPCDGNAVRVVFEEAQCALAPGQAAVFYQGDEVLGGGWIH